MGFIPCTRAIYFSKRPPMVKVFLIKTLKVFLLETMVEAIVSWHVRRGIIISGFLRCCRIWCIHHWGFQAAVHSLETTAGFRSDSEFFASPVKASIGCCLCGDKLSSTKKTVRSALYVLALLYPCFFGNIFFFFFKKKKKKYKLLF